MFAAPLEGWRRTEITEQRTRRDWADKKAGDRTDRQFSGRGIQDRVINGKRHQYLFVKQKSRQEFPLMAPLFKEEYQIGDMYLSVICFSRHV
jgi:hypothetical protein